MPDRARPRILVIDDDAAVCAVLCDNLRDIGYTVLCAANGVLGLESIRLDGAPDLVITDIIMPKQEGLETIRQIRQEFPQVKIIAMSGGGRQRVGDFLAIAEKLGSHASMPKPIDIPALERLVATLVGPTAACA